MSDMDQKDSGDLRAKSKPRRPMLGVVLGAGGARGWCHVGVLQELERMGLPIDIVCGCSSGALVAASYATGRLNALNSLADQMTKMRMLRFFDVGLTRGGLIEGRWLVKFLKENVGDPRIETLPIRFGAVATEFQTGREIWLKHGSLIDSTRASIALPGLMTPFDLNGRILVDGALVNPLPVALCRALGADIIIAVKLDRNRPAPAEMLEDEQEEERQVGWRSWIKGDDDDDMPSYGEVVSDSIFTMTSLIQRVRLATNPVDVLIEPDVTDLRVLDFHRAQEFIERGRTAALANEEKLQPYLEARTSDSTSVAV